jgi:two-component system CheB/CheR fusion protein
MESESQTPESGSSNKPEFSNHQGTRNGNLIAVGVGASAGGLEAFTELLTHLPPSTGMAFILVQHLDPHHESALPELLAGKTNMPVIRVKNDTPIEPDHVYVIPPNNLMTVRARTLVLETRPEPTEKFKPIDAFFNSLALEFHFNAVGIVLSGTASDGTLGLRTIKGEGGITFAQNQTARFDSMPRSAIAAGVVDFVLPPRRIAEELSAIAHRPPQLTAAESELARDDATLRQLLLLLRSNTGVDFTEYKQTTVLRRLTRRMVVRKMESLDGYFELLQKDGEEIEALFDDLLINVTEFFRDPAVFETVKRLVFPAVTRDRKQPYAMRAWIPGCSSGEEVYSIAIALVEFFESEDLEFSIQIFGTDVSEAAIHRARAAIYDESAIAKVSPERLRRFFVRTESSYQISHSIREMCIFSRHNVAKDPPLSRMDLISCRNLLIYLAPSAQRRIVSTFGYALQPAGCLILGPSETLGTLAEHFQTLDEPCKIYSKKANSPQGAFPLFENSEAYAYKPAAAPLPMAVGAANAPLQRDSGRIAISRYGPAGVVADERLKIVECRGETAQFLAQSGEAVGADLMDAVRPDLRAALSTAIEQARRTNAAVLAENIPETGQKGGAPAAINVVPVALEGDGQHFLILFGHSGELDRTPGGSEVIWRDTASGGPLPATAENALLRQELKTTRNYLQAVVEELRSTNEEAQSANEELQSTNEEMQTSKEELQSSNEELNTINAEMQSRNADLARVNDDLNNLLASMNMPIVMTGSDLRIRRFTPMAEKVLRLIATDIGRPIADLKPRIDVPNLEEILQQVLDTLQPFEQEVRDWEGRLYLMRVRPYRTADNRIDGAVLQLLDVTDLKRSLDEVKHARDFAETIVNTVPHPILVLNRNLTIEDANRAFYDALNLTNYSAKGKSIYEVDRRRFDLPAVHAILEQFDGAHQQANAVEIGYTPDSGEVRILSLTARRLRTLDQEHLILLAFEDITERKRAAEARYRRLFESARDGIVLVDAATGEIMDLNPFAERLLGYPRPALIGRKLWETEPMRTVPRVHASFQQIRDQGVMRFDDLTLRTQDGRNLQTEVIASVYSEGDRRAIQFNIRDVSERKKFERELQETQKLESLGLLAGGIAHDFNNLLTGIIGNASLAVSEITPDQPLRMRLREIIRAGERAAFLTRQMLAYAGKGNFIIEKIDLGELIQEISTLVQMSVPKSVELKLDLAANLPVIAADPAQIQQVIMNLVINGGEAIGERIAGRVEVRTSVREMSARDIAEFFGVENGTPGEYVQLEVRDTGSGMDDATKARVFDPFFTTKFTGRGLGLAAVQGIVKGHGGAIRVYSTPGQGTSFLVLLPASRGKKPTVAPPEPVSVSIPPGLVALVIDDEDTIRRLAMNVLSHAGMKVLAAANGKEGVEMFREHNPGVSVIILDVLMPVMGGEAAFPLLKEINPAVPIILSSGFDESEATRRFTDLKPAGFLQKPYTVERLVESVAATVGR